MSYRKNVTWVMATLSALYLATSDGSAQQSNPDTLLGVLDDAFNQANAAVRSYKSRIAAPESAPIPQPSPPESKSAPPFREQDTAAPEPQSDERDNSGYAVKKTGRLKTWTFGALTLSTPFNWSLPAVSNGSQRELNFDEDWNLALTTRPNQPDSGGMLVMNWSNDQSLVERRYVRSRDNVSFLGELARRSVYRMKDAYNDLTGIEVVLEQPLNGKILVFDCHSPPKQWPKVAATCEEILTSVSLSSP